jgi:hypothetical protein
MIPFEAACAVVLVGALLLGLKYLLDYLRRKNASTQESRVRRISRFGVLPAQRSGKNADSEISCRRAFPSHLIDLIPRRVEGGALHRRLPIKNPKGVDC